MQDIYKHVLLKKFELILSDILCVMIDWIFTWMPPLIYKYKEKVRWPHAFE